MISSRSGGCKVIGPTGRFEKRVIKILEAIFGAGECCLTCVDLIMMGGDVVAWARGRENRRERRAAREAGQATVPLDFWNKAFWVMLAFVVLLSGFIVYRLVTVT